MHIPDNYLSPQTCAVMIAVMIPAWMISIRKVRRDLPKEKITMMGATAALTFLGMMFNVPLPGGTTGHAVGGTLAAILTGPYAACISISTALLLQALLFGDGGILAFGANCFNMALVLPFTGYAVFTLLTRRSGKKSAAGAAVSFASTDGMQSVSEKFRLFAAGLASYLAINAAALCAAIEFGIQPLLFKDASGAPMYCPYDLSVSVPAMLAGHLTIFGLAEIIFTVLVLAFADRAGLTAGDFRLQAAAGNRSLKTQGNSAAAESGSLRIQEKPAAAENRGSRMLGVLIALLIILTPLGLLAEGTAWGEWGTEEISSLAGYTPQGMANGFEWSALLPDYSFASLPGWFGYILSAAIGTALLLIIFRLFSAGRKGKSSSARSAA